MKTLNRVQLIGYLGADPKIFKAPSGEMYATLRLSTHHKIHKKTATTEVTLWHAVKVWGKTDYIRNNFMKGSHVLVEGMIDYFTVMDNAGKRSDRMEVKATHIMNLDR